jgi:DNA-directed RNA polymerase alpha subunit
MTEEEAKTKWCPMAQYPDSWDHCTGSACMAWRSTGFYAEINDTSIDDLELPIRVRGALKFVGYKTIKDIIMGGTVNLTRTPNFGKCSLAELTKILNDYGVTLTEYGVKNPSGGGYCGLAGEP